MSPFLYKYVELTSFSPNPPFALVYQATFKEDLNMKIQKDTSSQDLIAVKFASHPELKQLINSAAITDYFQSEKLSISSPFSNIIEHRGDMDNNVLFKAPPRAVWTFEKLKFELATVLGFWKQRCDDKHSA